jgi:hypothetical protein
MGDVYDITDVTTSVNEDPRPLPAHFALLQNHPNPFNPTTHIRYELPKDSPVRLVIYNVNGQVVRELVNGVRPAGRHVVEWDGRNATGDGVSSGVYFYQITAGTFAMTKKLILIK